jgi:hypothetical protein
MTRGECGRRRARMLERLALRSKQRADLFERCIDGGFETELADFRDFFVLEMVD